MARNTCLIGSGKKDQKSYPSPRPRCRHIHLSQQCDDTATWQQITVVTPPLLCGESVDMSPSRLLPFALVSIWPTLSCLWLPKWLATQGGKWSQCAFVAFAFSNVFHCFSMFFYVFLFIIFHLLHCFTLFYHCLFFYFFISNIGKPCFWKHTIGINWPHSQKIMGDSWGIATSDLQILGRWAGPTKTGVASCPQYGGPGANATCLWRCEMLGPWRVSLGLSEFCGHWTTCARYCFGWLSLCRLQLIEYQEEGHQVWQEWAWQER